MVAFMTEKEQTTYSISELAKEFDITTRSIRFYEDQGLLTPQRPGWPLFEIQQSLHPDPCGWMLDSLRGLDTFEPKKGVAVGVVMVMPDFPFCERPHSTKCGYPVYGTEDVPAANLHLSQVSVGLAPNDKLEMEETVITAGECVCTISGNGQTVAVAKKAAYRNLKKIELPNSPMYRTDIGIGWPSNCQSFIASPLVKVPFTMEEPCFPINSTNLELSTVVSKNPAKESAVENF